MTRSISLPSRLFETPVAHVLLSEAATAQLQSRPQTEVRHVEQIVQEEDRCSEEEFAAYLFITALALASVDGEASQKALTRFHGYVQDHQIFRTPLLSAEITFLRGKCWKQSGNDKAAFQCFHLASRHGSPALAREAHECIQDLIAA